MVIVIKQLKKLIHIKSLWLSLYLLKVILSLLLIIPFYLGVNSFAASSSFVRKLITRWDFSAVVELFSGRTEIIPIFLITLLSGAIAYIIIMQFINGGLYYIIVSGNLKPVNWREFFAECGANWGMQVKITLLMLLIYILLIIAGLFFVNTIGIMGSNFVGRPALFMIILKAAIMFLILLGASIFSDSVRAASIAHVGKPLDEIIRIGANYFRPDMAKLLGVFLITYIPFILIWILVEMAALKATIFMMGTLGILMEFILFQVSSFARTGQKLWYLIYLGRDFKSRNPGRFVLEQVTMKFNS